MNAYFPVITQESKSLPFYVATVGITQNETKVYRPDGIDDYQLLYCVKGTGNVYIQGETKKTDPGMGFVLPPKSRHHYYAIHQPWETHWITFNGSAVDSILKLRKGVFKITQTDYLEELFNSIFKLPRDDSWAEKSSINLYRLLIELKKCIATDSFSSVYDIQLKLSPAVDYMKANFSKPIELAVLADMTNISTEHFCRLFKAAYNIRPFEYITGLRLQKSKVLLVSRRDLSISQIGQIVGYSSASYFSKLFKKQENITPEGFRELH